MAKGNLKDMLIMVGLVFFFSQLALAELSKYHVNELPSIIEQSVKTTLVIHFTKGRRCSAVRVSDNLILSAAHCFVGYDGMHRLAKAYFYTSGTKHKFKIVEIGQFKPRKGKMEDWVLIKPMEGETALLSISIVDFPSKEEMERVLADLGAPIWAITYPVSAVIRTFPRPGFDGKGVFISKGYLKSNEAYKKYVLFVADKFQLCDERYVSACPQSNIANVESEWIRLRENSFSKDIYEIYNNYLNDGAPILYHTADYSNGSSGGGVFIEKTGNYLGLVPMGAGIGQKRTTYEGVGQLYRIDVICRQSKILSQLEKCQKLIQ